MSTEGKTIEKSTEKSTVESEGRSTARSIGNPTGQATELQQIQQRLWIKEQEINALKVQNRHLLGKLDEAEKSARPNVVNTQQIASDVQTYLRPVLSEIERSLSASFDVVQGTMRGIYQQSQRMQSAMETLTAHSKELEMRVTEQRKADQSYFQEKIFTSITTFCDRVERQLENRLKSLASVDIMGAKQSELLSDMDRLKLMLGTVQNQSEATRSEMGRIEKESVEINQKMIDLQIQSRNTEEVSRDVLQQIQNQRNEFRLLRTPVKTAPAAAEPAPSNEVTVEKMDTSSMDVTLVLDLLHSQKEELKQAMKKAEKALIESQMETGPESSAPEKGEPKQEDAQ